jgi:transposase
MVKTLEQAIAEISNLPDADQEQIGRKLLSHVERLRSLRGEIDKGIRSLDAGQGSELNIESFISQKNKQRGGT